MPDRDTAIISGLASHVWQALMGLFEPLMALVQRVIGAKRMPWVFLAPNLLFFATFVFAPLLIDFGYSLTGGTDLFLSHRPWDGTAQYEHLFNCKNFSNPNSCEQDRFWHAIFNTGTFVFFQVVAMVLASLITALALNKKIKARGFFRAVFFFPVLLSPVVVALIWKWILQRDGLMNGWITALGGSKLLFFISPHWAMFWAIFVSVWAHMGFYTLILLAGLQAIPADLYEAAQMDATAAARVLWRITLPLLMPNLIVVIVLALIKSVQTFDEVFVLTGGGPGTATLMIVQYIYETGFSSQVQNFGLAAAASVVLGLALFILTLLQLSLSRRKGEAL